MKLLMMLMALVSLPVLADDTNAELAEACQETIKTKDDPSKDYSKSTWCLGVVSGYVNMHDMFVALKKSETLWCIPEGVTLGQGVKIYVRWTQVNPEVLHEPSVMGWTLAMMKAFPCPSVKKTAATPAPERDL